MTRVLTRRVHDHVADPDGTEGLVVLVDRLWPRGISKERLPFDAWAKEVAPSTGLRTWFHGLTANEQAERFGEFVERYRGELSEEASDALDELVERVRGQQAVTLLFAVKDVEHNHATILAGRLRDRLR